MEGLLWLLIWGGLFYFMMRFGCGSHMVHGHGGHGGHGSKGGHEGHGGQSGHEAHGAQKPRTAGAAQDPVCGMDVAPDDGYGRIYEGREYRFCSRKCLDQFDASPSRYASK
jgi:YHS domain-containing protein